MSRRRKDPLRPLTDDERQSLLSLRRSATAPVAQVARAVMILAVSDGLDYQQAAREAGRRSGDAVSRLVTRFNHEGVEALEPRHGGSPKPIRPRTKNGFCGKFPEFPPPRKTERPFGR
ncbi:helix-turn-helix domain-containing protein [Zavarzinella formosa]|uniref:helix-turn-helix domain-containing protein n=1 Tax=Zavarzinella formosa TaxID=360055 RepID=UPI00031D9FA8|nr:helix-turn-helix domain-containing protein [Zavarzinella formosa]